VGHNSMSCKTKTSASQLLYWPVSLTKIFVKSALLKPQMWIRQAMHA